jgi:hypothetical protein
LETRECLGLEDGFGRANCVKPSRDLFNPRSWDDNHTVAIAHDQVARRDADVTNNHRQADRARTGASRRPGSHTSNKYRKSGSDDAGSVSCESIGDYGRYRTVPSVSCEQVTEHCRTGESVGRGHDHIARSSYGECGEYGEIIICAGVTRESWASK